MNLHRKSKSRADINEDVSNVSDNTGIQQNNENRDVMLKT